MLLALALMLGAVDGGTLPDGGVPFVVIPTKSSRLIDARNDAGIDTIGGCWLDDRTCIAVGHGYRLREARANVHLELGGFGFGSGFLVGVGVFWVLWFFGILPSGPRK